jgi:hypothetical protein
LRFGIDYLFRCRFPHRWSVPVPPLDPGIIPNLWISWWAGVSYFATVIANPAPSGNSNRDWINPLPKVFSPTKTPRWLSCNAPAKISLALAVPWLTKTTKG